MLDTATLERTSDHIRFFAPELRVELPLRINQVSLAADGTPDYSPEFSGWLFKDRRVEGDIHSRYRLKQAMRQLRRVAPREHDVVWQVLRGVPVEDIRAWLDQRAVSHGHPERYSLKDVVVLIVSGVDKLAIWY